MGLPLHLSEYGPRLQIAMFYQPAAPHACCDVTLALTQHELRHSAHFEGTDAAVRIVVAPGTGRGLGQGSPVRFLPTEWGRLYYWKVYNVAPDYLATLIEFLDTHALRPAR